MSSPPTSGFRPAKLTRRWASKLVAELALEQLGRIQELNESAQRLEQRIASFTSRLDRALLELESCGILTAARASPDK